MSCDSDEKYDSSDSVELPIDTSAAHPDINTLLSPIGLNGQVEADSPKNYCPYVQGTDGQPFVRIHEQPQARGFRFRYECEGPSHGGVQGEKTEKNRKSFPSIKIENYRGPARITVSLVTDEEIPKPHAHKLVGKFCQGGNCVMDIKGGNMLIPFPNLCIQHVTRKKAVSVLQERILESYRLEKHVNMGSMNSEAPITNEERLRAKEQATKQAKDMQLNVVKLCFQVFLSDEDGGFTRMMAPVISKSIFDSKSPGASALKICRMDKYGGCCTGNEEVFVLCEKVQKDDIAVRFIEQDSDGNIIWEGFGDFGPMDVHRQYAIVFKTPPYYNQNIDNAVNVLLMLYRKSDEAVSEPKGFTYYPRNLDKDGIERKRKKTIRFGGAGDFGGPGPGGGGSGPGHRGGDGWIGSGLNLDNMPNGGLPQFGIIDNSTLLNNLGIESMLNLSQSTLSRMNGGIEDELLPTMSPNDLEIDSGPVTSQAPQQLLCARGNTVTSIGQAPLENKDLSLMVSCAASASDNSMDSGIKPFTDHPSSVEGHTSPVISSIKTTHNKEQHGASSTAIPGTSDPEIMKIKEGLKIAERTVTALQAYASSGDVRYLLMVQRHLMSSQNEYGDSPLHMAVINNQPEVVENLLDVMMFLLIYEERINAYNYMRQTPLCLSIITKQTYILERLLKKGGDIMKTDRNGNTGIHLAVLSQSEECMGLVTQHLKGKSLSTEIDQLNYNGFAASHLAAQTGNIAALKMLVQANADVNLPDGKSGRTPLHHAVEAQDMGIAGYLLSEAEADVNMTRYDGNTALHFACSHGLVGITSLLLACGANPDIENEDFLDDGNDSEDEAGAMKKKKHGLKAEYYAKHNEKILRILRGEPYASKEEIEAKIQDKEGGTKDLHFDETYKSIIESGFSTMSLKGGDLQKLDPMKRKELSKLLDKNSDYIKLAEKLGLEQYIISSLEGAVSPTRLLLDYYEINNGTVSRLTKCLLELKREDAVSVIDEEKCNSNLQSEPKVDAVERVSKDGVEKIDSGVHSMSLQSHDTNLSS